ncbi:unnamed protein product (macronuclear) [Paramecium tetraurelia]|uniref:Uncharacterized protein n=1 Tax=Paramecium tetraurelia TaxID=5888 RepID=A0EHN3_PARTE|nr:uncharacterized protein GSPATT00027150001 [Paramecium tetraurelia]CAK94824.1 unnamed protein product [Paramecium tetraurelia]|eukprot:XP_001462197.1 hypothetical protein (macronuclear) [Paramecium tetraurelia strain d4-2]
MFAIITKKAGQALKINNSDYTHKINKVYACIKSSKFTSSKLLREVRITKHGLIQQKFKSQNIYSEKQLEYVELIPEIVKTSEIKGKEYKMAFENQKQKSKWVYFENYIDARKVRDFCYANAAMNNLRYNLAGFVHLLIKHFNETCIYFVLQKISKTRQEMERLSIIELNQSQTLSLFSPGLLAKQDYEMKQSLSFQENSVKTQGQDNQINMFLQRVVNEYLEAAVQKHIEQVQDANLENENEIQSVSYISVFQLSDHHKSKYLELNSSNQMYIS